MYQVLVESKHSKPCRRGPPTSGRAPVQAWLEGGWAFNLGLVQKYAKGVLLRAKIAYVDIEF